MIPASYEYKSATGRDSSSVHPSRKMGKGSSLDGSNTSAATEQLEENDWFHDDDMNPGSSPPPAAEQWINVDDHDDEICCVKMNDEVEYNCTTKQRLTEFYQKYNPVRIPTIDNTLLKYKGRENELFRKLEAKYVKESDDDDDSNDDDNVMDAPMSLQMQMKKNAQKKVAASKRRHSHGGAMSQHSMKLIPTFNDSDDDDDDDGNGVDTRDEVTVLTDTLRELNRVASENKMRRCVSEPTLRQEAPKVAFGVRENDTSTTTLNDDDALLSKPVALERSPSQVSFNDTVTLNHMDSFKDLLSLDEREDVWYSDVEMICMQVDCGLFNTTAQNQNKKRAQEIAAHRRKSTGNTTTTTTAKKAQERKSQQMWKKYGIDKKVKQIKKDKDNAESPKKKKGLSSFFGKKKKWKTIHSHSSMKEQTFETFFLQSYRIPIQ